MGVAFKYAFCLLCHANTYLQINQFLCLRNHIAAALNEEAVFNTQYNACFQFTKLFTILQWNSFTSEIFWGYFVKAVCQSNNLSNNFTNSQLSQSEWKHISWFSSAIRQQGNLWTTQIFVSIFRKHPINTVLIKKHNQRNIIEEKMSRDYTQSKDAHYTKILQIVGKQSKQKNNNKKNKGGCSMLSSKEIIIFVGLWGPACRPLPWFQGGICVSKLSYCRFLGFEMCLTRANWAPAQYFKFLIESKIMSLPPTLPLKFQTSIYFRCSVKLWALWYFSPIPNLLMYAQAHTPHNKDEYL